MMDPTQNAPEPQGERPLDRQLDELGQRLDEPFEPRFDQQLGREFDRHLDERLAALSREIAPPRNLWHGIVVGIARPQRRALPFALAAATACAIVAGALVWAVLHSRPASMSPSGMTASRSAAFEEPSDPGYTAMRTQLETTFNQRLALLSPETRSQIEASLAVIRKAHEDIRKALAAEPTNPVLEQLFQSTWHDEFDLYDRVVQATQPTLART